MVKAIETVYNGHRFRSRLEARWAVFLDALGIQWAYEQEGFDLGKLGWYLPDFFLLKSQLFVEVKPIALTDEQKLKVNALDEHPPVYAMGCFPVVGMPEIPKFVLDEVDRPCEWSGNTSFLLLREGLRAREMIEQAVTAARLARFGR